MKFPAIWTFESLIIIWSLPTTSSFNPLGENQARGKIKQSSLICYMATENKGKKRLIQRIQIYLWSWTQKNTSEIKHN